MVKVSSLVFSLFLQAAFQPSSIIADTNSSGGSATTERDRDLKEELPTKARGPTKAADGFPITVSNDDKISDLKPTTKSIGTDKINKSYTLSYPDASYISIHFKEFDLPKSCSLQVNNGEGKQAYVMRELGRHGLGKDFWARHVTGDTMKLSMTCAKAEVDKAILEVDQFAAGYPLPKKNARNLRGKDTVPSFMEGTTFGDRELSICGADDKQNAVCYINSDPVVYDHSRAAAKLIIGGLGSCTGWLASFDNKLFTNEHCIASTSDVLNTDFAFMYEEDSCSGGPTSQTDIYDGLSLLAVDAPWDYSLIQLDPASGDPASLYGYLEIENRQPPVGEEIYIPQHPGGRPKELGVFDTYHNGNCNVLTYSGGCAPEDMRYTCDTEGGSSGSPVLSRITHKVVALHHCGGACNGNLGAPIYRFYDQVSGFLGTSPPTISPAPTDIASPTPTAMPTVSAAPTVPAIPYEIESTLGGCLHTSSSSTGTDLYLQNCDSSDNQKWLQTTNGNFLSGLDLQKCIGVEGNSYVDGTPIEVQDCVSGSADQEWTYESDGTVKSVANPSYCWDSNGISGVVYLWTCDGTSDQYWIFNNVAPPPPTVSPAPSAFCQVDFALEILTDSWGNEVTWEVRDNSDGSIVLSGGPYLDNTLYNIDECVDYGCYTFEIFDSYGDGIYSPGYYELTIDGTVVASGGDYGYGETAQFCGTAPPSPCYDSTVQVDYLGTLVGCNNVAADTSVCSSVVDAQSFCPLTCGTCATYGCDDFNLPFVVGGSTYSCALLASQDQATIDTYCAFPDAYTTCRATCGNCV